jgi:hypothetical protein
MSQGVDSPEQQVRMIITKVVSVTFDRCQAIIQQLSVGPAANFRQEPDNA